MRAAVLFLVLAAGLAVGLADDQQVLQADLSGEAQPNKDTELSTSR